MKVGSRIRTLVAASAVLLWSTSGFAAPIVYDVDRIVDDGSVTGTITTDGTLGVLGFANILDWTLTLASPDLRGGSPQVITKATGFTSVSGSGLSATVTALTFDFSIVSNTFFLLQGGSANSFDFWCVQTNNCFDFAGSGEAIGFNVNNQTVAERVTYTTSQIIATAAGTADPIPEPGTLVLLASGMAGALAKARRRRSAQAHKASHEA